MSGADVSFDEHERLAFAMLAVDAGDIADVKEAMMKIITSAPPATDVALVLLLAISHARERALRAEAPCIVSCPPTISRSGGMLQGGHEATR